MARKARATTSAVGNDHKINIGRIEVGTVGVKDTEMLLCGVRYNRYSYQ